TVHIAGDRVELPNHGRAGEQIPFSHSIPYWTGKSLASGAGRLFCCLPLALRPTKFPEKPITRDTEAVFFDAASGGTGGHCIISPPTYNFPKSSTATTPGGNTSDFAARPSGDANPLREF